MQGRSEFTQEEAAWIRRQLRALRRAERDEQKQIRAALRSEGFRISDWTTSNEGFTASDFDRLVQTHAITLVS